MTEGILDTSILIDRERIESTELPDEQLITTITLAELSTGPLVASTEEERARRQLRLQRAETDFDPLQFDASAALMFGQVSASLRRAGRKAKARTFDALIAAIALANGLPVFTCNPDDFEHIDGLRVIPVRRRS